MSVSNEFLKPEILEQVSTIGFRAKLPMVGSITGLHRSPLHGLSPEFADYRSYTPGDDLKNLDWKAYARSDRFYIKRFEEESNLRACFVVDTSASMSYQRNALSKFETAATVATTLAALLLKQRDSVSLITVSNQVHHELRSASLSSQLIKIIDQLDSTKLAGETDLGPVVALLSDQVPRRGVVFVLSDLLTPLDSFYESLGKLQHAGHEVILLHILDRDEIEIPFKDSVIFRDIEGDEEIFAEPWAFQKAYTEAINQFRDEVQQRCQFCGIDYLPILTDDNLGLLLSHYLHTRQFRSNSAHRGRMSSLQESKNDQPAEMKSDELKENEKNPAVRDVT